MAGALSMAGRHRYDAGGPVASSDGPPPQPALSQNGWQDGPPSPSDDEQGALRPAQGQQAGQSASGQSDPKAQQKIRDLGQLTDKLNAMGILAAAGMASPTWMQPGATNVPALAAAGAMLQNTHGGGFAESLGNAFTAASGATEAQRKLEAENQMRLAQLAETSAYREGILGVRGQHEDNYAQNAQTNLMKAQAMSSVDQARAAYLTARAAMAGASHATEGDILSATVNSLLGKDPSTGQPPVNPDTGKPWSRLEAYQAARSSQSSLLNANTSSAREGDYRRSLDLRQQALENAQTDKERTLIAHSDDMALARATSILNANQAVGGKLTLHDALTQVQAERAGMGSPALPTAPSAGGSPSPAAVMPAASRPAPAMAAPPAVAPPPRPAGVPPGSAYSPSRNAWRTPDGTVIPGGQ